MPSLPRLSPTSYALLGLLARAPASAYELNNFMQKSLVRVFWPRAESHVYSEPKKLLAHGLVRERREKEGGRSRNVYSITAAGRRALREWLEAEDSAEHRNTAEFMLKLILADGADVEAARATVERADGTARSEIDIAIAGIEYILQLDDIDTSGMPWNGISINLMAEILAARHRFNRYAREATAQVAGDSDENTRREQARAGYSRALRILRDALEE